MDKIKSIAITGKGGTGKTMLATLMIKMLVEEYGKKVLAIDADSAMSLPYTLGIKVQKTVSEMRKDIIGLDQLKRQINNSPLRSVMSDILSHGAGFDLLTMGRPEEPGCFCTVNELLRYGIDTLIRDYDITIIDGEAGPEQLNRRVLQSIDVLLVVADMSARSMETAGGIIKVARSQEDGINVKQAGLILNRVRNDQPSKELIDKIGLDVWGSIPEDATVNEYDRAGKSLLQLPVNSLCPVAVRQMLSRIVPAFDAALCENKQRVG